MTPTEKVIEAAKHDAKNAVDQLIDAIGRILLAHLETTTTTTPPPPTPNRITSSAPHRPWTPEEDAILHQHYPRGGAKSVQAHGVNRTARGIQLRAHTLRVHARHANANTTPKPPPTRNHRPPKNATERALTALLAADQQDTLLDQDNLPPDERRALKHLKRTHHATHEGAGLWRPTLAGLTRARNLKQ